MARKKRKSIYKEQIKVINISDIIGNLFDETYNSDWQFQLDKNWIEKLEDKLKELDFYSHNYISDYGVYWCGVLTLEPFDRLENTIGREEDILNEIKNHHLKMEYNNEEGVILRFYNPTSSPLYRFFNQHKEDGFGQNVPYSVNALLYKIEKFLKYELETNITYYGEWIQEDYQSEEEIA